MKEKYLHTPARTRESETAYRIWMFAVATEALSQEFDKEKCNLLLADVKAFASGTWMEFNGSDDERDDVNWLIDQLEALATQFTED